jgi:hypothetical protein
VQQDPHAVGALQLLAVEPAEVRVGAPDREAVHQPARVDRRPLHAEGVPDALVVDLALDPKERLGAPVEGLELVSVERPAAVRDPVAGFEDARLGGQALARPERGRAAQDALAPLGERVCLHAGGLALVERLLGAVGPQPAALEQDDADPTLPAGEELPRQRDSGRARAHDAHVGLQVGPVLEPSEVIDHGVRMAGCGRLSSPAAS